MCSVAVEGRDNTHFFVLPRRWYLPRGTRLLHDISDVCGGKTHQNVAGKVSGVECRVQTLLRASTDNGRHKRNASLVGIARSASDVIPLGYDDQSAPVKGFAEHGVMSVMLRQRGYYLFSRFVYSILNLWYVLTYWWKRIFFMKGFTLFVSE